MKKRSITAISVFATCLVAWGIYVSYPPRVWKQIGIGRVYTEYTPRAAGVTWQRDGRGVIAFPRFGATQIISLRRTNPMGWLVEATREIYLGPTNMNIHLALGRKAFSPGAADLGLYFRLCDTQAGEIVQSAATNACRGSDVYHSMRNESASPLEFYRQCQAWAFEQHKHNILHNRRLLLRLEPFSELLATLRTLYSHPQAASGSITPGDSALPEVVRGLEPNSISVTSNWVELAWTSGCLEQKLMAMAPGFANRYLTDSISNIPDDCFYYDKELTPGLWLIEPNY